MVRGNLTIKPLTAVLTRDTEFLGKMDPYCVFTVGSKTFKSPVDSDSGTNPQWVIIIN
jgi:hypothetical protein